MNEVINEWKGRGFFFFKSPLSGLHFALSLLCSLMSTYLHPCTLPGMVEMVLTYFLATETGNHLELLTAKKRDLENDKVFYKLYFLSFVCNLEENCVVKRCRVWLRGEGKNVYDIVGWQSRLGWTSFVLLCAGFLVKTPACPWRGTPCGVCPTCVEGKIHHQTSAK